MPAGHLVVLSARDADDPVVEMLWSTCRQQLVSPCLGSGYLVSQVGFRGLDSHRTRGTLDLVRGQPAVVLVLSHGTAVNGPIDRQARPLFMPKGDQPSLRGKIVFALSCSSSTSWMERMVDAGALAVVGFRDDIFLGLKPRVQHLTAQILLRLPRAFLLEGGTLGQTVDSFRIQLERLVRKHDKAKGALQWMRLLANEFSRHLQLVVRDDAARQLTAKSYFTV